MCEMFMLVLYVFMWSEINCIHFAWIIPFKGSLVHLFEINLKVIHVSGRSLLLLAEMPSLWAWWWVEIICEWCLLTVIDILSSSLCSLCVNVKVHFTEVLGTKSGFHTLLIQLSLRSLIKAPLLAVDITN